MSRQLIKQFETLRSTILNFSRELEQNHQPMWLAPWNGFNQKSNIEDILLDLWYQEEQDGRETRIYPGLVGLNRQQITFANEVNIAKDNFRKEVNKVKENDSLIWREIQAKLAKRYQVLNETLSRDGLSRLHLKQVFRHLPLIVNRPEKVGFSWYTSGRSIKRITKLEAYDLLTKLNTESQHIVIQLERLAGLSDSEPLARVQKQAPVLRANLVFPDKKRRSLNVSLPLLFPHEGKQELPIYNIPTDLPPPVRNRLIRSDNKIEDDAYLPSIRVHRYSENTRNRFY